MRDKPQQQRQSRESQSKPGAAHNSPGGSKSQTPRKPNRERPTHELGQTSDEYGLDTNPLTEMTAGDEIALVNPDVDQIGPPGGAAYERGFGDQTWRRDR